MATGDPAEAIANAALTGQDPRARQALGLFVRIYGAKAGDLALTGLCRGGLYLAGGIAPKILPRLRQPDFLKAFRAKGRFDTLMAAIPVAVVTSPDVGLRGAVLVASRLLQP
ncbi:MAG: glucokinase, partial [Thermodesulfobacteriota bacterium]